MEIERALLTDAGDIHALQQLAYISEADLYNDYSIAPLVESLAQLESAFQYQTFLKASTDGRIYGSVRAEEKGGTCYVGRLMVHPDFRSRGLGSRLLSEIEVLFATVGRFELFTGHKSEKNIFLYQKLGYEIFKTEFINTELSFVYLEKRR